MTNRDFFRALGEVRDDLILSTAAEKEIRSSWRRYLACAACAAVVLAAALALGWEMGGHSSVEYGSATSSPSGDAGASAGGGMDGENYWLEDSQGIASAPSYSVGVEIGQLSGPGEGGMGTSSASDSKWLPPEEILAQNTVIFRGTVRELQYYVVQMDGTELYYTKALVEVTDCVRGELASGDICSVLYMGAKGYMVTSLSGPLADLDVGGDAVWMPARAGAETGWYSGDRYFCYADVADFYLSEGMRYVFADTGEGLDFERSAYPALADAETLDQVMDYLRENVPRQDASPETPEETLRAAGEVRPFPADPATEEAEGPSGSGVPGPAGAREAEPGAVSGEKPAG